MKGKHDDPKSIGFSKISSKINIYTNTSLPKERRKISNNPFKLTPKGTRLMKC